MSTDESRFELHCQENVNPLEDQQEAEPNDEDCVIDLYSYINVTDGDEDDECLKMLLEREISMGLKKNNKSFGFDEWLKSARREAISWNLKSRAVFGFQLQTAYLSVTYFDQFLSRQSIKQEQTWTIELLSVACLSLAAKMLEPNPPLLPEFRLGERNFQSKAIQRTELLVLNTLEWRMNSATPLSFLHYFFTKLCSGYPPPKHTVSRTLQLITGVMKEINLMEHKPSVIAAAVTLAALDRRSTRQELESKMHPISGCGFLEIEEVLECYNLIEKLETKNPEITNSLNISDPSPTLLKRPQGFLGDDSSCSSAVNAKRRRLTFNEE